MILPFIYLFFHGLKNITFLSSEKKNMLLIVLFFYAGVDVMIFVASISVVKSMILKKVVKF
jgi:hypothetical protein